MIDWLLYYIQLWTLYVFMLRSVWMYLYRGVHKGEARGRGMGAFKSFHYVHYRISRAGVHVVLHLKRRIQKIHLDFKYFIDVTVSRKKRWAAWGHYLSPLLLILPVWDSLETLTAVPWPIFSLFEGIPYISLACIKTKRAYFYRFQKIDIIMLVLSVQSDMK